MQIILVVKTVVVKVKSEGVFFTLIVVADHGIDVTPLA